MSNIDTRKILFDFVESVPEEKADLILQAMRSILEDSEKDADED